MQSVCKGCKFYNACGSNKRAVECKGKEMKLDIQQFGGRGATSGNNTINTSQKLNKKTQSIIKEWESSKTATAESEKQFRAEIEKMSYNEVLKLAQRLDEVQLSSYTTNSAFAINIARENVIKVGRRKNANKWSTDFGKWRK